MWVFIIFLYMTVRAAAALDYLLLTNVNRTINKLWLKSSRFFLLNVYAHIYTLYVANVCINDKVYRVFFTPPLNNEYITKIYSMHNLKEVGYLTKTQFDVVKCAKFNSHVLVNGICFNGVKML